MLNTLNVDTDVDADGLVATLDELYATCLHRRAFVESAGVGERLAGEMRRRKWLVERVVFMALRRPRDRPSAPGLAREVDEATLQRAEEANVRAEPYGHDAEVVRQVVAMRSALAAAVPASRFFVGAADGIDAAVTTLYADDAIAQVEDVVTLRDFRRRGLARATVSAAVDAALEMGSGLVFLVADADDWPKDLYGRLGFDPIGHAWSFTRPGPEMPGAAAPGDPQ